MSEVNISPEDFFEREAYSDVYLPKLNQIPSFGELKNASSWAESIKKRIQRHKREGTLKSEHYHGFRSFLNQLLLTFDFD